MSVLSSGAAPSGLTGNHPSGQLFLEGLSQSWTKRVLSRVLERHGAGFNDNKCPLRLGRLAPTPHQMLRTLTAEQHPGLLAHRPPRCRLGQVTAQWTPKFIPVFAHCPNTVKTQLSAELRVEGLPSWGGMGGARQSHAQRPQAAGCSRVECESLCILSL